MKKLFFAACVVYLFFTIPVVYAQAPTLTAEQRYELELNQWIERLSWDESHHQEGIIILDTNNRYSYSCLQFQYLTFKSYAEKYDIKGEIGSCEVQKTLAKAMIRDNWNNWKHWTNSVLYKTAGYPPKLDL